MCIKLLIFLFTYLPIISFAQLEADNWIYNSSNYLNFNRASFVSYNNYPVGNDMFFGGVSACYSDKYGKLLFAATRNWILDKNFKVFPSIDERDVFNPIVVPLKGIEEIMPNHGGATQSSIAMPYPGKDSVYIYFHINCAQINNFTNRLYYSIIDMRLRDGLGEIDPIQRNILVINERINFKLSAVLHCNKKDVWLVGHYSNSDKYFSILIDQNGVSNSIQTFNGMYSSHPSFSDITNIGLLKFSPLGNKLGAAFKYEDKIELMDFNTSTGLGSNPIDFKATPPASDTILGTTWPYYGPYGLDFSPTGKVLYVTSSYGSKNAIRSPGNPSFYLHQYDLQQPNVAAIKNSQKKIDEVPDDFTSGGGIQIANNGEMYVNRADALLHIQNPEILGLGCNTIYIPPAPIAAPYLGYGFCFPNFLQSYFKYPLIATGNCEFQNISFNIQNPIGVSNMVWDFGDPASGVNNTSTSNTPTHIFSTQGSYMVKAVLYNSNGCAPDTIRKVVYAGNYKVFLGNDTLLCPGDSLSLRMHIPNAGNRWSDNSTDTIFKVRSPGTYYVTVGLGDCVATDTIVISAGQKPSFSLGNDTIVCSNNMLTLQPTPSFNNAFYLWSNGNTNFSIPITTIGNYWLQITNSTGCKNRDTIAVNFKTLPNYSLGNDTSFCQKDTILLNATVANATSYTWNTGASTPTIKAYNSNTYWCAVNKEGCIYTDTINVLIKPLPTVNLGNDTTLCEDKTYTLNATNTMAQYQWQNGSANANFTISQAGQYFVKVTMQGCISNDTVNIQYQLKPRFSLGADKVICIGQAFILNPNIATTGLQYLWQDGSLNNTFNVTQQGRYYVDITNTCGTTRDEIVFTNGLCKVYIPNAFTPNNDGLNDIFKIGGGETIKDFKMVIYNRWGNKIFETQNILQGWDGTLNNKLQPTGSYIYKVSFKDGVTNEPQYYSGTVTLLK